MNEDDLLKCAALMKIFTGASPEECWSFAVDFVEAMKAEPEEEHGIIAIKPKRKYVRKTK